MAEKAKTITDIAKADAFYDAVMKYKRRLERVDLDLEAYEKSGEYKKYDEGEAKAMEALQNLGDESLTEEQKAMVVANKAIVSAYECRQRKLSKKEEYLKEIGNLEPQIKVTIAKYIVDTEKEKKKIETNRETYAKYIEEEKAKYESLKSEVDAMEKAANEDEKDILESKKEQLETLKSQLEKFGNKLASYDQQISKIDDELKAVKDKYKDYIELSKEDLTVPQKEEKEEETKSEKDETEKDVAEKNETKKEETEKDVAVESNVEQEKNEETQKKTENKKVEYQNVGVATIVQNEKSADETKAPEKPVAEVKETDEQAYERISKSLLKRKGQVSNEDVDKLISILSEKENFDKLNIKAWNYFPLIKSRGEKVYIKLGKLLDKQIRDSIKDEELLKNLDTQSLKSLDGILHEARGESLDNIAETFNLAMEKANDKELESLKSVKERWEKFGKSAEVLLRVKKQRKEFKKDPPLLPGAIEVSENKEEPVKEKSGIDELSAMVKSDEEIAARDEKTESTRVEDKSIENHEVR